MPLRLLWRLEVRPRRSWQIPQPLQEWCSSLFRRFADIPRYSRPPQAAGCHIPSAACVSSHRKRGEFRPLQRRYSLSRGLSDQLPAPAG